MPRSSNPLALSVVTLTQPGDVTATFERITEFDDRDFGFNHNQTWAAMPKALRGVLKPEAVASSFSKTPVRVQKCITALCQMGQASPLTTMGFQEFPAAGLKTVEAIDWDPDISVRVKATCWHVVSEQARILLLQPRKLGLETWRLAAYLKLGRQAYCQGDWIDAGVDLIDLSGSDDVVTGRFVNTADLPDISDREIRQIVETFVAAKRLADAKRASVVKKPSLLPMAELLDIE